MSSFSLKQVAKKALDLCFDLQTYCDPARRNPVAPDRLYAEAIAFCLIDISGCLTYAEETLGSLALEHCFGDPRFPARLRKERNQLAHLEFETKNKGVTVKGYLNLPEAFLLPYLNDAGRKAAIQELIDCCEKILGP